MTLPTTSPRDGVKKVVVYFLQLGLLGFGGAGGFGRSDGKETRRRPRLADQGADARGNRHLPITPQQSAFDRCDCGAVGLIAFPLLQPTWVMLKQSELKIGKRHISDTTAAQPIPEGG